MNKEKPSTFKERLEQHKGQVIVTIGGKGEKGTISKVHSDYAEVKLLNYPMDVSDPFEVHFGSIVIPAVSPTNS